MDILIVGVNRFTHPSGLCRFTANLAQTLSTSDEIDRVTVIIGRWQLPHFTECFELGHKKIAVVLAECNNNVASRYNWYYHKLPALVRRYRPHVVQLAFPIPFIRSKINIPIITTVHDLYSFDCPETIGFPNVLINRYVLRHAAKNSSALVCISHFTYSRAKKWLGQIIGPKKVEVIYQYVQTPKLSLGHKARKHPFLLSVAQHWKHKNLDVIIHAFGLLRREGKLPPYSELCIVGADGPETPHLLSIISSLGLNGCICLCRSVSDGELARLYAECEALVVASSIEGFCLPAIEASVFPARIVCADIPVLREVGSESTTVFRLGSDAVDEVASALKTALAKARPSPSCPQERFSMVGCREGYVRLYRDVLTQGGSTRCEERI